MKKTSLALMIALIAVGCEKAPVKPANTTQDPAMMAKHMGAPGGAHTPAEVMKDEAKPAEGAVTAPAVTEEKPAEEKPAEEKPAEEKPAEEKKE